MKAFLSGLKDNRVNKRNQMLFAQVDSSINGLNIGLHSDLKDLASFPVPKIRSY